MITYDLETIEIRTLAAESDAEQSSPLIVPVTPKHSPRQQQLFRSLDVEDRGVVTLSQLETALARSGLAVDDPRLQSSRAAFQQLEATRSSSKLELGIEEFVEGIRGSGALIERALRGELRIPEFGEFCAVLETLYSAVQPNTPTGNLQLSHDPVSNTANSFAISVCSIDGQRHHLGDAQRPFAAESLSEPIQHCLLLEKQRQRARTRQRPSSLGDTADLVGASGSSAQPLTDDLPRPGAADGSPTQLEFELLMRQWAQLAGGEAPCFNHGRYHSKRQLTSRCFGPDSQLRDADESSRGGDLLSLLELHVQSCCIEVTTSLLSVIAGTLANGGICPTTGRRVLSSETVQSCLAQMSSSVLDLAGAFGANVHFPLESSASGAMLLVVPNVLGLCVWSPRLDGLGHSVRGLEFCRQLVQSFDLHPFAKLPHHANRPDPRVTRARRMAVRVSRFIHAASRGEVGELEQALMHGESPDQADYDGRTALHLAAAEAQLEVVKFLLARYREQGLDPNTKDRWGGTALDDAIEQHEPQIERALVQAGVVAGGRSLQVGTRRSCRTSSPLADELIWAASLGKLATVQQLVAAGASLDVSDYDSRTPLHLAAAEGHVELVRYLLQHGVRKNPRDRWHRTPADDALSHGHTRIVELILDFSAKALLPGIDADDENQSAA